MIVQTVLFAILFGCNCVSGEYKRWLKDTNMGNPANWNAKRAPCGNDVVIIPDQSPVVYMQLNTTIKELVLPKNGEIIFDKNSVLSFSDQPQASGCPDFQGDVEFTAVNPVPWFDPASWCFTSAERGSCDVTSSRLDVERVPCTFDDVIFPRDHLYFADISGAPSGMAVKSLKMSGTPFTSASFTQFLGSDDGKRMFKSTSGSSGSVLDVTRKQCDDVSGCACGNDRPEMYKRICQYANKSCKRPRCQKTIQPVGSCCKMCGAVFNITRGYGFNLADFKKLVKDKFFPDVNESPVNVTTSITSEGWLQMVLADLTGDESAALGYKIKADFDDDLSKGGHRYAIDGVQFSLATGTPIGPSQSAQTGGKMSGGSIAGIFFGVVIAIIVVLVIVVVFVYRHQGKPLPVSMDSLPKLPPLPKLQLPPMPRLPNVFRRQGRYIERGPDQPQTAPHVDPGFANPLYDSSPFDDGNMMVKEMELMAASETQPTFDSAEGGFNNPLYASQHGGMAFHDPSAVEAATGEEGGQATAPVTSSASAAPPTTAVLVDTNANGAEPDSTI